MQENRTTLLPSDEIVIFLSITNCYMWAKSQYDIRFHFYRSNVTTSRILAFFEERFG